MMKGRFSFKKLCLTKKYRIFCYDRRESFGKPFFDGFLVSKKMKTDKRSYNCYFFEFVDSETYDSIVLPANKIKSFIPFKKNGIISGISYERLLN